MKNLYGDNICIIAPHPDDEVLGLGGSIKKFTENGIKVNLLIISGHLPPLYPQSSFETTKHECLKSSSILGVNDVEFAEIPATFIQNEPISKLNGIIQSFIFKHLPNTVFIPFPDRHVDHKLIFEACMVCTRPTGKFWPKLVLTYETLSETDWNAPYIEPVFIPEWFIDIDDYLEIKLQALNCYQSQIKNNESRNVEAVEALAKYRGSQNGYKNAEGFKLIRSLS
jgi:LmbE family N-acetylglucosaminyl deacetylase